MAVRILVDAGVDADAATAQVKSGRLAVMGAERLAAGQIVVQR